MIAAVPVSKASQNASKENAGLFASDCFRNSFGFNRSFRAEALLCAELIDLLDISPSAAAQIGEKHDTFADFF